MGLTDRTSDLLNTRVNALLDRLEDENESADYAVEQLRDELKRVKEAILDLVTEKKRLEKRRDSLQEKIEERNEQAREAVAAGREDLAREVLRKKQRELNDLESLDEQVSELADAQEELIERSEELERRVDHYRAKRAQAAAREQAARADLATKGGVASGEAGRYAEAAADDIDEREARAAALEELEERGVFDDDEDLDAEIDQLRTDDEIEDELSTIRKEMGKGRKTKTDEDDDTNGRDDSE
ncbi:phage shock protein A (PspA) family protein [Halogranum gelatinilyticum]|uniref:Phage shock protein A (PspA) family protein n=1 Tax=Halogranum gelatinilyticum TaxID=660521 RepID=A0A1G9XWE9_9EURY|nr:PspA/IM30 family protein [Halogranum gelatinilyticum]SDN01080.1 phage shock protein A (PspA) family protein [Halogranum gelatinilyticum]